MLDVLVMRIAEGLAELNTLVIAPAPLRFQIAPGTGPGLGIAGVPYTLSVAGTQVFAGTTDANGEVPILGLPAGPVTLRIFDTDYEITLHATGLAAIDTLTGQQQRLDQLGYVTGHLLTRVASAVPDDGLDGPRTQQAIMNFQLDASLTVDGDIGPQTTNRLRTELRE